MMQRGGRETKARKQRHKLSGGRLRRGGRDKREEAGRLRKGDREKERRQGD